MNTPIEQMSSERVTRLEELMNTHQSKYEAAIDKFRADFTQLCADLEKRDAETARHQRKYLQWLIGLWISGVIITISVLGFVIRLQI